MEKAMDKIRDEMAGKATDLNVQYVGEQLTRHIMAHPADAPLFYVPGKSIMGALKALEDYARKHKSGMMACIDPDTGMRIILEYYGVKAEQTTPVAAHRPASPVTADLDLDALLAEV